MENRLREEVAIVTGTSGARGRAVCELFARQGAAVAAVDTEHVTFNDDLGIRSYTCQSFSDETVRALVAQVSRELGSITVLVNDSSIAARSVPGVAEAGDYGIVEMELDDWISAIDATVKSGYLFARHAVSQMVTAAGGTVVNLAALEGPVLGGRDHALATGKAGMLGLTRALASTYGASGVRANVICSPPVGAELDDKARSEDPLMQAYRAGGTLARPGRPEEVAQVALFLASAEPSFVTGAVIHVDGGINLQ